MSPAETLERIRPHFQTFGITRLANITGLDWIGVPVTLAVRPNAATLSNGSGKGFSLEAAMTSGAMEAIELFHAEEASLPTFQLPYEALTGNRLEIEDLPLTKYNLFTTWWPYRWTQGWDILHQEEVSVPWWMIHMGPHPLRERDLHTFQVTSNGLASGNNLLEAINAGLFEVIERDAVTCHRVAWDRLKKLPPIVDPGTIEHPLVLDLLDRLASAKVGVMLFDCMVDTAVPVYMAYIYDLRVQNLGVYRGYGAHLDPEIAMIRAITEAVQARAIYIAGSRDDVFRHSYLRLKQPEALLVPAMQALTPTVDARARVSEATPTFEGDTQAALGKLKAAGLRRAIVVDLSMPEIPIKVVKVIVPGLEGYMFDFYEPGRRANAFLDRSQAESR
ncbi:YcaO-like family protein [Sorangium sp. So ce1000]|uniref:YcaO-like family protein n=1 Tax=Sorangium sp. So ce1000 TaxID=3133325 RepID=UPI003F5F85C7